MWASVVTIGGDKQGLRKVFGRQYMIQQVLCSKRDCYMQNERD